jgi:hypothetical protein
MAKSKRVKRILNVVPSKETENDWRYEHAEQAGLLAAAPVRLPASKDLRESWWTVGDQKQTGSCVGWASVDSVIRWHFVKAGFLRKDERLSPRFVWMASKETDDFISQPTTFIESSGTTIKCALDVARKFGTVRDGVLPFDSGKLFAGEEETFYAVAAQLKIAAYFNISLNGDGGLDDWRRWIATKGPIVARLDVDRTWDQAADTNGNLDAYLPENHRGGHAVALVGYTPDRFIVRNSWGPTSWGDKGFGYASPEYAQAAFTEAYGVAV